jgi:hypothetical protein
MQTTAHTYQEWWVVCLTANCITSSGFSYKMFFANSATYSRGTSNQPSGGVEASNADHGSHVSGVVRSSLTRHEFLTTCV